MIQTVRDKYLQNKIQTVVLNKKGLVLESDNLLFQTDLNQPIQDLHPFFESFFTDLLKKNDFEDTFYCVHLDIYDIKGSYDIYFNSGSKTENPYLIFYDFTSRYNFFQTVAQEKNESVLNFRQEELKNHQLKIEKDFKNKFLANISHDLRTPIAAILGFLEVLEHSQLNYNQKDILKTISLTGKHLNGLVEDLLDISKIESGEFSLKNKTFDFIDLINQIEKIYLMKAAAKNIDLVIEIDSKLPRYIIADRVKLFQLFVNTLDNAIKFTESGEVKLVVNQNFRRADNLGLSIQVADTGMGFSSRNKELAFESFTRLHTKDIPGLGLGLSIVQEIVSLMNGQTKLKSVLKKGTTVEITLPVKIDLEISAKNKRVEIKEFLVTDFKKKQNVLVVDNNETNQLLLMKLLANHGGFYIDISDNGKHAIDMVENNDYDLILMDMDMPIMNGIEASIKIKQHDKKEIAKLPIIAMSANPTADEKKICKEIGIKDYLPRPFTREELFLTIYKVLKVKKTFN
jgi:two-component system, sensor histidine kinase